MLNSHMRDSKTARPLYHEGKTCDKWFIVIANNPVDENRN